MSKAKELKGVYNLNPTDAVMKQGSEAERQTQGNNRRHVDRQAEAHEVPADNEGMESRIHNPAHPAMQTRHSHAKEMKHSDGRKHEDHHHAVKMLKGMK